MHVKGLLFHLMIYAVLHEYAEHKGRKHRFSKKTKKAGPKWLKKFLQRYPDLVQKKAHNVAIFRANAATMKSVERWFTLLKSIYIEKKISDPRCVFNCDESGLQDVPVSNAVIGERGFRAYRKVPADKGHTTSILSCFNAVGEGTDPVIILKGKRVQKNWREEVPLGVHLKASDSAYINKRIFADFGRLFVARLHTLGLTGKNILLILDSHSSHVFNWEFIRLMHAYNVTVLSTPPHTTHCLQPLDRGPFYSLKRHWNVHLYMKIAEVGGRKLTRAEWFDAFLPAHKKAMTVEHLQNAFRVCGIFPLNRLAIKHELLTPGDHIELALDSKKFI